MGGANRLAKAFPKAKIRAFAMMRVMSDPYDFADVEDPCIGSITRIGEDTSRIP